MTTSRVKVNKPRTPRYKVEGAVLLLVGTLAAALVYLQFRGDFTATTQLTMLSARAGLVMDPGSKVTYNGVEIGRVASISETVQDGRPAAKFILNIYSRYLDPKLELIPANVAANIKATTVFGNKYVSLTTPKRPSPQNITPQTAPRTVIDARSVTTEVNTLFQTIISISQKVDPVKVNLTLSAAAQALTGLGDKFGRSIVNGNAILDDINPQMPQIRHDIQQLAALGDIYAAAAPDLLDFLNNAVVSARTLNTQQKDLDAALLSAAGFGNTGADIVNRGGPYLQRGAADLVSTARLLDTYSPELFCVIHGYAVLAPIGKQLESGNGYSGKVALTLAGAENPYVYPDNLPRVNARGGPGGRPGCWEPITHDLWPAPYLVMDTGNSIAPYNHFEIGSPYAIDYVWGRQVGDNTINP